MKNKEHNEMKWCVFSFAFFLQHFLFIIVFEMYSFSWHIFILLGLQLFPKRLSSLWGYYYRSYNWCSSFHYNARHDYVLFNLALLRYRFNIYFSYLLLSHHYTSFTQLYQGKLNRNENGGTKDAYFLCCIELGFVVTSLCLIEKNKTRKGNERVFYLN